MCGEMIAKLYTHMWGDNATHMERGYICMYGDDTCVGDNTTHEGNDIIHICKDSDENDF